MVTSHASVSALSDATTTYQRRDEGVLALMGGTSGSGSTAQEQPQKGLLTPRTLIKQSSPDRTSDYNALMNCLFTAHKQNVSLTVASSLPIRKKIPQHLSI
jgi:hypothetical protein